MKRKRITDLRSMSESKKVLILAIGCSLDPWLKMRETSRQTWDSIQVEGVETVFYWGQPRKENIETDIYFDVKEGYNTMGYKLLYALEWAYNNKLFDYIARVNGSCYVDKRELIQHVQTLPETNLFAGGVCKGDKPDWCWGGLQYLISKDVVKRIIDNQKLFKHNLIEDMALSYLVSDLGIPFTSGKGCSIDRDGDKWRCIGYGTESFEFANFDEFQKQGHFFYRCKQDLDRDKDEFVMRELFRIL